MHTVGPDSNRRPRGWSTSERHTEFLVCLCSTTFVSLTAFRGRSVAWSRLKSEQFCVSACHLVVMRVCFCIDLFAPGDLYRTHRRRLHQRCVVIDISLDLSPDTLHPHRTEPSTRISPLSCSFFCILFSFPVHSICVSAIFQHSVPKCRHILGVTSFTGR